ncbi:MAG TPA: accessory factor UbiK family protein [Burkholderiaceae bacterium]|nr:accessory factor UbiK family protein [Burkholderiaceae bacterium]
MSSPTQTLLTDLQQRVSELLRASPAADIERNVKALLGQTFQRMDLVTREEFDVQVALLERLRARVTALESRLAELEARGQPPDPPAA